MATRRNVPGPLSSNPNQTIPSSQETPLPSDTRPAVSQSVLFKLLACTFAMVVLPLGSYFFTLRFVFRGNSTYAGGFAALMANVVLIVYIVLAVKEDEENEGHGATGVDVLKRQVERKKGE